jgi:hypothetical protein
VVTAKEELRNLAEALDEDLAALWLEFMRTGSPALRAALFAPDDDEPETPEEAAAVARAFADVAAGRVYTTDQLLEVRTR